MRSTQTLLGATVAVLLAGCSSTPLALAPVGPNPGAMKTTGKTGDLEVYSALTGCAQGNDPTWYQHTDYTVRDATGKRVRHVENQVGFYETKPKPVELMPGKYYVDAEANGYVAVAVPVIIRAGQTTRVHLDGQWHPAGVTQTALVNFPQGGPVGWASGGNP
jgi:hypothetical protein